MIANVSQSERLLVAWVVTTTPRPSSASALIVCIICRSSGGSSPLVGSSSRKIEGRPISSTPQAVRLRCPPESEPIMLSIQALRSSSATTDSTCAEISASVVSAGSRRTAAQTSASRTVSLSWIVSC